MSIKGGSSGGVTLGVTVSVDTINQQKIDALADTLERIANGSKLTNYLKSTTALIEDLNAAANRFDPFGFDSENLREAEDILNIVNSLIAQTGEQDLSKIISGYDRLADVISQAREALGGVGAVAGYERSVFENAYKGINSMVTATQSFDQVVKTLSAPTIIKALTDEISELKAQLESSDAHYLTQQIGELRDELGSAEADLLQYKRKLQDVTQENIRAYETYLKFHGVDWQSLSGEQWDTAYRVYDKLRDGSITVIDAIAEIRTALSELFDQTSSRGIIDEQSVTRTVELTQQQGAALEQMTGSIDGVKSLEQVLAALFKTAGDAEGSIKGVDTSIADLVNQLRELSSVDLPKIDGLVDLFNSIQRLSKFSGSTKSLDSFIQKIRSLASSDIRLSSLASLSNVHLDGFKDVRVSKTITYIGELSKNVNSEALEKLSKLDFSALSGLRFSGWKNFKLSGGMVSNIDQLSEAIKKLKIDKLERFASIKWNNLTGLTIKRGAIDQIQRLSEAVNLLRVFKAANVEATENGITVSEVNAMAEARRVEAEQVSRATRAIKEYYRAQLELYNAGDNIRQVDGVYVAAADGYEELAQRLNETRNSFQLVTNAENMNGLSVQSYVRIINTAADAAQDYANKIDSLRRKELEQAATAQTQTKAASEAKDSKDHFERASRALRDYYNLLVEVTNKTKGALSRGADGQWMDTSADQRYATYTEQLNRYEAVYRDYLETISTDKTLTEQLASAKDKLARAEQNAANAETDRIAAANSKISRQSELEQIKDATAAIKEYYAAQLELYKRGGNGLVTQDSTGAYITMDDSLRGLVDRLNSARTSFEMLTSAENASSMSSEGYEKILRASSAAYKEFGIQLDNIAAKERAAESRQSAAQARAEEAAQLRQITRAYSEYYQVQLELYSARDQITFDNGRYSSNSDLEYYTELANRLNQTSTNLYSLTDALSISKLSLSAQSEVANIAAQAADKYADSLRNLKKQEMQRNEAQRAKEEAKAEADAVKEQVEAYNRLSETLTRYYKIWREVVSKGYPVVDDQATGLWVDKSENGAYTLIVDQLNTYRQELQAARTAEAEAKLSAEQLNNIRKLERQQLEDLSRVQVDVGVKAEAAAAKERTALEKTARDLQDRYAALEARSTPKTHGAYYTSIQQNITALRNLNEAFKNGEMSSEEYRTKLDELDSSYKSLDNAIRTIGADSEKFTSRVGKMFKSFSVWFGTTRIVMSIFRYFKQMVQASIELESAFNRLQIVTGATDAEMKKFSDTAFELAGKLGKSVSEVTSAIETFSRLGYNLSEAGKLAEYATIMSNVADTSLEDATTGITSIIKGFGMDVSNAEHVADVLIEVGQKYAVSASELMVAYEKAGAALNATNTSFEKSAGLIAAANASVQNANTVGKHMPSITAM